MNHLAAIIFGFILVFSSPVLHAQQSSSEKQSDKGKLRPECGTAANLGNALGSVFLGIYKVMVAAGSTLAPHLGYRFEKDAGAVIIAWPIQWAFGTVVAENTYPNTKCRRKGPGEQFKAHRMVLEPQIVAYTHHPDIPKTYFGIRPAYRFVYHAEDSKLGYGVGVGGQFTLEGDSGFQSALSSEIVLQYGACCMPGFLDVALRYDYTFSNKTNGFSVLFGWSYY